MAYGFKNLNKNHHTFGVCHDQEHSANVCFYISVLDKIREYRSNRGRQYSLPALAFVVLVTELANCNGYRDREAFLKANWEVLLEETSHCSEVDLPEQAPDHTTIWRFCKSFDQSALTQLYLKELRLIKKESKENVSSNTCTSDSSPKILPSQLPHYAMDGKSRSGCKSIETERVEIDLALFDVKNRQVLGVMPIPDKKGEATQAQTFFKMYGKELPAGVVTFDAGITGPNTIKEVLRAGHQYIAAIKGNAGEVYDSVVEYDWSRCNYTAETRNKGHGRIETRKVFLLPVSAFVYGSFSKYEACGYVVRVDSIRVVKGEATAETRYFVASQGLKGLKPANFLELIRNHWIQENGLHWVKDAVMGEDDMPSESHKASRLFGTLKSIAVSIGYQYCGSVKGFIREFRYNTRSVLQEIMLEPV